MNEYKALAYVVKEIHRMQGEHAEYLSANRAESFEEYKNVCGIIRGLSLAENLINDLVQRMEKNDD